MIDIRGMHLSNGPQYDVEQMLEVAPGCVTLLHFQVKDDPTIPQWADRENDNWIVKLQYGYPRQGIPPAPDRKIHIRMYHPNFTELGPEAWALHAKEHLERVESGGNVYNLWDNPNVCVSPANEQNLHYECGDPNKDNQWFYETVQWYATIADWNLRWAREIDRLLPDRKALLCWPAFAYGHDPLPLERVIHSDGTWGRRRVAEWSRYARADGEYGIPEVRQAIEAYDLLAAHPYGHLDWPSGRDTVPGGKDEYFHMLRPLRPAGFHGTRDPGGILAQIDGMPLLVTEHGTFTHSWPGLTDLTFSALQQSYERFAASGRVVGITPFIWYSDSHEGNQIWPNGKLREWLTQMGPQMSTAQWPKARQGRVISDPVAPPIPPPEPPPAGEPPAEPGPGGDQFPPRLTSEHQVMMIPRRGEGWASFAARARGYGQIEPGWGVRSAWADEIRRHNGLGEDAMLTRGRSYRIPWFEVS